MSRKEIIKSKIPEIEFIIRTLGHKIDAKIFRKELENHNLSSIRCERCDREIIANINAYGKYDGKMDYRFTIYVDFYNMRFVIEAIYDKIKLHPSFYCERVRVLI